MAHAFNGHTFGEFLSDAQRLLTSAREQERELSSLAGLPGNDAISQISRICLAATEHRQSIEAMLTRLLGQQHTANGAGSTRPRLLIVDDSDGNRETTAAILEDAGFEVLTAMNGLEGVLLAHLVRPSVILMDVTMPVMNGVEAARLIRVSSATQDVKVIAYTARPDVFDGAITKWFVDVILKPAHPEAIVALVQRVVAPEPQV
jgi:two-component system, cell cycle response regulator DivK